MTDIKPLQIGDTAPLFTLPDTEGTVFSLKEILKESPVLLFFYPGDMTPGCIMQFCAVRNDWESFKKINVRVLGINPSSAESHKQFIQRYKLPFPLLVDKDKKISSLYGTIRPFFKTTITRRTVIGIQQDGKIFFLKTGIPKHTDILKAFSKYHG